jgi:hypothetical protein
VEQSGGKLSNRHTHGRNATAHFNKLLLHSEYYRQCFRINTWFCCIKNTEAPTNKVTCRACEDSAQGTYTLDTPSSQVNCKVMN